MNIEEQVLYITQPNIAASNFVVYSIFLNSSEGRNLSYERTHCQQVTCLAREL